jgi:hypothetical protein
MKTKTLLLILSIFFSCILFVNAAGNPNGKIKVIKKDVSQKIIKAGESGQNAILVVTDNEEAKLDDAITLATETAQQSYKTVVGIVNRESEDNADLIKKYNLQRFSLPYILILSANGSVMGGVVPGKVTPEMLAAYVPSGCFNQAIESNKNGNPTYLLVTSDDETTNSSWVELMEISNKDAQLKADIITIDPIDESEASFLKRLGYLENMPLPMLVVLNKDGKISARYTDLPEGADLTSAAAKVISSGCRSTCPSSKSCVGKKTGCGSK